MAPHTDLGDGDRIFRGAITGTMLVKHLPVGSAPPQIHKGKMDCQAILHISENQEGPKTGVCTISAQDDKDLAYVEIRCAGVKGECKGDMTWVWGKGGFKGITGTTPFVAGIFIEKEKEGWIHGSAHWPEMTYTLPWPALLMNVSAPIAKMDVEIQYGTPSSRHDHVRGA